MSRSVLMGVGLFLCLGTEAGAAQTPPPPVTVGTWNLEWLGTPTMRRDGGARSLEDLATIATLLADVVDLEVVVLVEINVDSPQWLTLRDLLADRGFRFIVGEAGQQVVVLGYDADEVTLVSAAAPVLDVPTAYERPDPSGGVCRTAGARRPVVATLRAGGFDFTVVGVHLKSGRRPNGCADDTFTSWVRGRQSAALLRAMDARLAAGTADADVVIVGDFNGGVHDGGTDALRQGGFRILTEAGNRAASSDTLSYRKGPYDSALDHIAVPAATERDWIPRTTMYFPVLSRLTEQELAAYHRRFSDHALAWTDFRTDLPDDD